MRLQEKMTLDLGVKVTQNIGKYPLHHVTYAAVKFEAIMSNSVEEGAFAREHII